jgi:type VI secretion system secreted protein VgrG
MLLADTPGPDGYPHINTAWRIVSAPTADEALMSSDSILTGQSDISGKLALSDADEKTLHEAYNKTPGQVWLVYVGQVRLLSLSRQSDSWSESDKFYEAIDAMGYSDQPFSAQQSDVDQSFAQWARQELKANDGDAVLGKLKGDA